MNSGALAEELARLGKENSELRSELENLRSKPTEDIGGLSFEDMYDILDKTILDEKFTANDILVQASKRFDGVSNISHHEKEKYMKALVINGLINLIENNSGLYGATFTEPGRKYFFKLRSLEKYKDWNNENQVR